MGVKESFVTYYRVEKFLTNKEMGFGLGMCAGGESTRAQKGFEPTGGRVDFFSNLCCDRKRSPLETYQRARDPRDDPGRPEFEDYGFWMMRPTDGELGKRDWTTLQ